MQKLPTSFGKNVSVYAIFNDQRFNDTLTIDIVSFEHLGPDVCGIWFKLYFICSSRTAAFVSWIIGVEADI